MNGITQNAKRKTQNSRERNEDSLPTIFELSSPGRPGSRLPRRRFDSEPRADLPQGMARRTPPALPEVSELDAVRHFVRLSQRNLAIDTAFYPLGSCTMKYNPKADDAAAALPGFAWLHPHQPDEQAQGALALLWHLERLLAVIVGLPAVSLEPAAGAHGELTGIMMIQAYQRARGDTGRDQVLVPDSAHGTNPATAAMCGYQVVTIPSDRAGNVDLAALRQQVGPRTAALMLTNPNTLGLFDQGIEAISRLVHEAGGLLYGDGANLNALLGLARPGDMGFDVMHLNLHKTFATPHGGGGPGAGPVAARAELAPYLPVPRIVREGDSYRREWDAPRSIGRIKGSLGNFGVLVRAYAFIRQLGPDGLRAIGESAVLAANYLCASLKDVLPLAYDRRPMHEFVLSGTPLRARGVRTLDLAKRLIDHGVHPPTIYFPLIVEEALMIEPTETESVETLDQFAAALRAVVAEAREQPELVRSAPHTTVVGRLDEAQAARRPDLRAGYPIDRWPIDR